MIKHCVETYFSSRPNVGSPLAHFLLGVLQIILGIKTIMVQHLEVLPADRSFRFTDLLNATRPAWFVDFDLLGLLGVRDGGGGRVKSEGIWC